MHQCIQVITATNVLCVNKICGTVLRRLIISSRLAAFAIDQQLLKLTPLLLSGALHDGNAAEFLWYRFQRPINWLCFCLEFHVAGRRQNGCPRKRNEVMGRPSAITGLRHEKQPNKLFAAHQRQVFFMCDAFFRYEYLPNQLSIAFAGSAFLLGISTTITGLFCGFSAPVLAFRSATG